MRNTRSRSSSADGISGKKTPNASAPSKQRASGGACVISTDAGIEPIHRFQGTDMNSIEIRALNANTETLAMLADLLVETVAAGGSVSFMHPLAPEAASAFWERS